jgi:hypothetical protein
MIAFSITRQRPAAERRLKPPRRNWTKALKNRHPVLTARRVKALDWDRHEKNIYEKVTHWFEVIEWCIVHFSGGGTMIQPSTATTI